MRKTTLLIVILFVIATGLGIWAYILGHQADPPSPTEQRITAALRALADVDSTATLITFDTTAVRTARDCFQLFSTLVENMHKATQRPDEVPDWGMRYVEGKKRYEGREDTLEVVLRVMYKEGDDVETREVIVRN